MISWFVSAQSGVCLAFTGLSPTLLLSWLKGRESVMDPGDTSTLDL